MEKGERQNARRAAQGKRVPRATGLEGERAKFSQPARPQAWSSKGQGLGQGEPGGHCAAPGEEVGKQPGDTRCGSRA